MNKTPLERRYAQQIMANIMQWVHTFRSVSFREPSNTGMRIFLSVPDAQLLDEEQSRQGDFFVRSEVGHNDTGTLLGMPFTVDKDIPTGTHYIGYRVHTPDWREDA